MQGHNLPGGIQTGGRIFATTQWNLVLTAGEGKDPAAGDALEALCQSYWYPIYVYVRRKGHGEDDAKDLTQEFFSQLIHKERLKLVDRKKGKFRTFLLSTLDYFLAREWSRAHRQKRGGQFSFVSLDDKEAVTQHLEPADNYTPEEAYAKQWAITVLEQAMDALEAECAENGKSKLFQATRHLLSGERGDESYGEICRRLEMAEGALRVTIHRLRRRYGELARREIARTVADPAEVDAELQFLFEIISR